MISKKNEILQFLIGLEYFHSGCKHVEVAVVCEAWSHGVTIFTPDPLVSDWLSFTKQGRDWLMIISGHRVEERAEEQGVRHDEGAMEQSAVDIIRHTLHFIPDSVLSQQQKLNMIEINRKKLKAAFILHLFSATFVLLDIENFQGFLFINILFHFCLIWSLAQPGMIEPMVVTGIVNILAIIFEIVFLSIFWTKVRIFDQSQGAILTVSQSQVNIFCSVMAVINLVGRFVSGTVLILDTRKLMRADPKYKVEKKQKDKEVAVVE